MTIKFSFEIDSLELRICDEHLQTDPEQHDRAEIVKWRYDVVTNEKRDCCTVAYWNLDNEGYNLRFVGSRFFDLDSEALMRLATQGQQILNDEFNRTQN